jgi:hypothetical protein
VPEPLPVDEPEEPPAALAPPEPEPEPPVAPDEPPVAPDEPPVAPDESPVAPDEPPADDEPPEAAEDPDPAPELAKVVELAELLVLAVDEVGTLAATPVGTVSEGAPALLTDVVLPPLPQAASPADRATPAANAASRRERCSTNAAPSRAERIHPPATVWAVVQVPLRELVAPIAEAKVLDRPGQLRGGGGERQQLRHDLQRLAGRAVDILDLGLSLDDHFAAGRGRPHPVLLAHPHLMPCYQRSRRD